MLGIITSNKHSISNSYTKTSWHFPVVSTVCSSRVAAWRLEVAATSSIESAAAAAAMCRIKFGAIPTAAAAAAATCWKLGRRWWGGRDGGICLGCVTHLCARELCYGSHPIDDSWHESESLLLFRLNSNEIIGSANSNNGKTSHQASAEDKT